MEIIMSNNSNLSNEPILNQVNNLLNGIQFTDEENSMTKEQKFYNALQDVFIGARIEGEGGFVNLMRIKSNYYQKIEKLLKHDYE